MAQPAEPARPALPRWWPLVLLAVVWAVAVATGLIGIDFGHHWDEGPNLLKISNTVRENVLLPHWYDYPSMIYWLSLLVLAPSVPRAAASEGFSLLAFTESQQYLLQNRVVFLLVASLAILWIYLGVWAWRKRPGEALLAAAAFGLSWEVAYHSRFVAPDAITVQFTALTVMALLVARSRPHDRRWLWASAVAAGLATATKYTAGLLLFPVLILAVQHAEGGVWQALKRVVGVLALFGATYLVITPGTIIEPVTFVASLRHVGGIYAEGHEVHTIAAGAEHLSRLLAYFGLAYFSRWPAAALPLALLNLAGIAAVLRTDRKAAALLLVFPLLTLAYFGLSSRVMLVRNVLPIGPILAVFVGRGAGWLWDALRDRRVRAALAAVLAGLMVLNAVWLGMAAQSIRLRGTDAAVERFRTALAGEAAGTVYVTPAVAHTLGTLPAAVTRTFDGAESAAFTGQEVIMCYPANRQGVPLRWFGPGEINYRYYPTWQGEDRIVWVPLAALERIGAAGCLP